MSDNPFGQAAEFNPFASVSSYDPFKNTTGFSPVASPPVTRQQPPQRDDEPFGRPDASFYSSPSQPHISLSSDDEEPTVSYQPEKSSSGIRVTTSEEKPQQEEQSMWAIEYYQQFFNVESSEVGWRCLRSMWPFNPNFIQFVHINPDLYGPFWITTTLIFMLAAGSNFATFLQDNDNWRFDFFKLTTGAGTIWGYAFLTPALFWLYFKWVEYQVSLTELFCIYGYSLFIYTPISIICIAPNMYVQWAFAIVACLLSTSFLLVNLWGPLRTKVGHALLLLVLIGVLHVGFGFFVQLYFFQEWPHTPQPAPQPGPQPGPAPPTSTPTPTPTPASLG